MEEPQNTQTQFTQPAQATQTTPTQPSSRETVVKSPCKIILTGEHAVVYGKPSLAISIEPFNTIAIRSKESEEGKILLTTETATERKTIELSYNGQILAGETHWPIYVELLQLLIEQGAFVVNELVEITLDSKVPKGVGASSSIAAGLALAAYRHTDVHGQVTREQLFEAAQFVDRAAHGGSPSGIDAMTVIAGPTKLTRVLQSDGQVGWNFEHAQVQLPTGTTLLVIDTYTGGERAGTGEMIKRFAGTLGLLKSDGSIKQLSDLTANDLIKLKPFEEVYAKITRELKPDGNAKLLGDAIDENHLLLAGARASSRGIDYATGIARSAGALGAKATGAGGEGGAAIALVRQTDVEKVRAALKAKGFNSFEAKPTKGLLE